MAVSTHQEKSKFLLWSHCIKRSFALLRMFTWYIKYTALNHDSSREDLYSMLRAIITHLFHLTTSCLIILSGNWDHDLVFWLGPCFSFLNFLLSVVLRSFLCCFSVLAMGFLFSFRLLTLSLVSVHNGFLKYFRFKYDSLWKYNITEFD